MIKYILIFLSVLVFFGLQITDRPFFTKGESREAVVIQNMFSQNNFILPTRNADQFPSKPPMFHWTAAAISNFAGINEFTIRAPSALYASLTFIYTFIFTKSLSTSLILASSVEFDRSATSARVDMCFCFFLTLASFLIFKIIESKNKNFFDFFLLLTAFTCAVLSKGPAGLAFPAAITAIYALKTISIKKIIREKSFYIILLLSIISLVIAGIWYYKAYLIGGNKFLSVHIGRENIGRFVHTDLDPGHIKPFYFSFIYLLVGFLPWSLILPFSLYQAYKHKDEYLNDKLFIYSVIWFIVYLTVVTLTMSKRVVYLMPAYPACAYIIAKTFNHSLWPNRISKACNWITGFICFLILTILLFQNQILQHASALGLKGHDIYIAKLSIEHLTNSPILFLLSLIILIFILFTKKINNPNKTALAISLICVISNSIIMPKVSKILSPKSFAINLSDNSKTAFYKEAYYSINYYAKHDFKVINKIEEAQNYNRIIVSGEKLEEFKKIFLKNHNGQISDRPILYGKHHLHVFDLNFNDSNTDR